MQLLILPVNAARYEFATVFEFVSAVSVYSRGLGPSTKAFAARIYCLSVSPKVPSCGGNAFELRCARLEMLREKNPREREPLEMVIKSIFSLIKEHPNRPWDHKACAAPARLRVAELSPFIIGITFARLPTGNWRKRSLSNRQVLLLSTSKRLPVEKGDRHHHTDQGIGKQAPEGRAPRAHR